jgi:hypothetical protein
MSIKSDVQELESIRSELKNLTSRRKNLKDKEKLVENRIQEYLKAKNQPGVKHQGIAVTIEEKEVSGPKNSKQRDSDAIAVIAKYVNKSPEKVLEEIMEARKGASIFKSKLKMKKFKEQSQV